MPVPAHACMLRSCIQSKHSRVLEVSSEVLRVKYKLKVDTRNKLGEIQSLIVDALTGKGIKLDGKPMSTKDFDLADMNGRPLDAGEKLGTIDLWQMKIQLKFEPREITGRPQSGSRRSTRESTQSPPPPAPSGDDRDDAPPPPPEVNQSDSSDDEADLPLAPPSSSGSKASKRSPAASKREPTPPPVPPSSDDAHFPFMSSSKSKRSPNPKKKDREPEPVHRDSVLPPPPGPPPPEGQESKDAGDDSKFGKIYHGSAEPYKWPQTDIKARCTKCRNLLAGKKGIHGGGGTWHDKCFLCYQCQKPISSRKFLRTQGQNLCTEECLKAAKKEGKLAEKVCKKCKKYIMADALKLEDAFYHPECHVCRKCKIRLEDEYAEVDGRNYCEKYDLNNPFDDLLFVTKICYPVIQKQKQSKHAQIPEVFDTFAALGNGKDRTDVRSPVLRWGCVRLGTKSAFHGPDLSLVVGRFSGGERAEQMVVDLRVSLTSSRFCAVMCQQEHAKVHQSLDVVGKGHGGRDL
eukprot:g1135.t1